MNSFDPERYPGMDDCICKPMQRDHLLCVLARWLDSTSSDVLDQDPTCDSGAPLEKPEETSLPLDLDRAIDEFMGKKHILYAVLGQFINRAGDQIAALRQAVCKFEFKFISSEAHRLKGGASNLRAHRLTRVASDLEEAADNNKKEEICRLIEMLAEEFQNLERFFQQQAGHDLGIK